MWQHICSQNRENITQILTGYIQLLTEAKEQIAAGDEQAVYGLFDSSRNYRNSIPDSSSGPDQKAYVVYCDIIDEAGGIAAIATILASNHLSIKNIGIIHNREFEEGFCALNFMKRILLRKLPYYCRNTGTLFMSVKSIQPARRLRGEITIPGDKSISHRAVMFGSLARGTTKITHFLNGADCLATIDCFRQMGISIEQEQERVLVHGKGLRGLTAPSAQLYTGNSGTTTRLLSGILSGQSFTSVLSGDESLNTRPMNRIMTPLTQMGANITSIHENGCAPLQISLNLYMGSPISLR